MTVNLSHLSGGKDDGSTYVENVADVVGKNLRDVVASVRTGFGNIDIEIADCTIVVVDCTPCCVGVDDGCTTIVAEYSSNLYPCEQVVPVEFQMYRQFGGDGVCWVECYRFDDFYWYR